MIDIERTDWLTPPNLSSICKKIKGAQIENQQFGVANKSDVVWFGIMGLARGLGNGFIRYPTIVDSLAAQGYTQSKLFSLDLGGQVSPGREFFFFFSLSLSLSRSLSLVPWLSSSVRPLLNSPLPSPPPLEFYTRWISG